MVIDVSWNTRLKVEIVAEIARLIGAPAPHMSTGSTEPREIFDLVNSRLGLAIDPKYDKPGMARAIVEASGGCWAPDFESRGATVTKPGLVAVLEAVQFFVRE
jgi:hypothetical protein